MPRTRVTEQHHADWALLGHVCTWCKQGNAIFLYMALGKVLIIPKHGWLARTWKLPGGICKVALNEPMANRVQSNEGRSVWKSKHCQHFPLRFKTGKSWVFMQHEAFLLLQLHAKMKRFSLLPGTRGHVFYVCLVESASNIFFCIFQSKLACALQSCKCDISSLIRPRKRRHARRIGR